MSAKVPVLLFVLQGKMLCEEASTISMEIFGC